MKHEQPVRYEDVAGVKSRISWGAVLAGSVVTLACYLVLGLFLTGLGMTINDTGSHRQMIGLGTVILGVFCMGLALFTGGWVTTQMTAGETKCESVIYGILTWATVTGLSVVIAGMGAKAGYHGLLGATYLAQHSSADGSLVGWEDAARKAGMSQERIAEIKKGLTPDKMADRADTREDDERAYQARMAVVWTTLVGTILAASAAVGGALVGSGPEFRLIPRAVAPRREVVTTP